MSQRVEYSISMRRVEKQGLGQQKTVDTARVGKASKTSANASYVVPLAMGLPSAILKEHRKPFLYRKDGDLCHTCNTQLLLMLRK
jgi:hypothetical protein